MNVKMCFIGMIASIAIASFGQEDQSSTGSNVTDGSEPNTDVRQPFPDDRLVDRLSEEQKESLKKHRTNLVEKHKELNEILKNESAEFAEISEKNDLAREDRLKLVRIRRDLILSSHAARAKIKEIRELQNQFGEDHPQVQPRNRRLRPLRRGVREMRKTKREIDQILAEDSEEYGTLLKKENKSPEDFDRIKNLRKELIRDNKEAQALRRRAKAIKRRIHDRIRRVPPDRPKQPTDVISPPKTDNPG